MKYEVIEIHLGKIQVISTHRKAKAAMEKAERLTQPDSIAMFAVRPRVA